MALGKNREVDHFIDQRFRTYRVKGTSKIYKNGFVGITTAGYARALVAGDAFGGVAFEECDNSAGADGAKTVRVYTQGDFVHALAGAAQTDLGRPVFASADDTLTFVAAGNSYVGTVQDLDSSAIIILRIDPERAKVKTIVHPVENLGAGADIAARAIHSFSQEGWIVSARVVNQASAAAGIDAGNTSVVTLAINAGNVASKTYNNAVTFPAANAVDSLGTITNHRANPGDVLTLAVTNGVTADPGPFLVEVDYV